ncbi:MAG: 1-phosphofructokinase [Ruminococcaceae bacterium]|nr:1-phosphofructokinase [Oscillospiraceae bacterium]
MIYTLTLNPSLDYVAFSDTFNIGKTNRTTNEYIVPGGKGLNVSILLSRLGCDTTALGFTGGFTGKELERLLENENIKCDFEKANGNTRINIKLSGKEITEFNASGISLDENHLTAIKQKIALLKSGDWLCLSGSIPKGADNDIYLQLALCAKDGVKVVVDAVGEPLKQALKAHPFLIKPNIDELCDLFGEKIETKEQVVFFAKQLQKMGAQNVLVSLGGDGAVLVDLNGKTHFQNAPKGAVVNTVAAGDSMIAGFIHRYIKTNDFADSLKYSVCSGSATAFSKWLATPKLINELYENL